MCFDLLYNFCLKHFSFWEELSEIWPKMYIGLHVKCRLLLADCNETGILVTEFRKNIPISNFIKIRPVEAELIACGQTDRRFAANLRRRPKLSPLNTILSTNRRSTWRYRLPLGKARIAGKNCEITRARKLLELQPYRRNCHEDSFLEVICFPHWLNVAVVSVIIRIIVMTSDKIHVRIQFLFYFLRTKVSYTGVLISP